VVNVELLEAAKSASTAFDEAERQALLARTEYHHAVRRLHLAGASLREIAENLAISHQRVQQMVSGAGGTWWRKVWGRRNRRPDAFCTWCGNPPSAVAKLVAGPRVYLCDRCLVSAERAQAGKEGDGPFRRTAARRVTGRCSFCGKGANLVEAPQGRVCGDCLRMCREIVDHS
jgi:hypothetical protein